MINELSQLDQLIESDILDALRQKSSNSQDISDIDELHIEDFNENNLSLEDILEGETKSNTKITAEASTSDLVSILSQLLNNKTIEITIKIKD